MTNLNVSKETVDKAVLVVGGVLAAGTAVTLYPAVRNSMGYDHDYQSVKDLDREEVEDPTDMDCFDDED